MNDSSILSTKWKNTEGIILYPKKDRKADQVS